MKNRKKATLIAIERRNSIYNKTIHRNMELRIKNTELSHRTNVLEEVNKYLINYITRKRWWQFWKWFK